MSNPTFDPSAGGGFCRRTRREFLWEAGAGFTGLALSGLLSLDKFFGAEAQAASVAAKFINPLAPKLPQIAPKAKSVIFLFMYGGPSQVDTFDYKPALYPLDGKTIPVKTFGAAARKTKGASSARNISSNNTASAASGSATSFRTLPAAWMTSRFSTR